MAHLYHKTRLFAAFPWLEICLIFMYLKPRLCICSCTNAFDTSSMLFWRHDSTTRSVELIKQSSYSSSWMTCYTCFYFWRAYSLIVIISQSRSGFFFNFFTSWLTKPSVLQYFFATSDCFSLPTITSCNKEILFSKVKSCHFYLLVWWCGLQMLAAFDFR